MIYHHLSLCAPQKCTFHCCVKQILYTNYMSSSESNIQDKFTCVACVSSLICHYYAIFFNDITNYINFQRLMALLRIINIIIRNNKVENLTIFTFFSK